MFIIQYTYITGIYVISLYDILMYVFYTSNKLCKYIVPINLHWFYNISKEKRFDQQYALEKKYIFWKHVTFYFLFIFLCLLYCWRQIGIRQQKNRRKSKYNIIFETSISFSCENMQSKSARMDTLVLFKVLNLS